MAVSTRTAGTLASWARLSPANKQEIVDAHNDAIKAVLAGDGMTISGSGNGTSFSALQSMTWEDLANLLAQVLHQIDTNHPTTSTTLVVF